MNNQKMMRSRTFNRIDPDVSKPIKTEKSSAAKREKRNVERDYNCNDEAQILAYETIPIF